MTFSDDIQKPIKIYPFLLDWKVCEFLRAYLTPKPLLQVLSEISAISNQTLPDQDSARWKKRRLFQTAPVEKNAVYSKQRFGLLREINCWTKWKKEEVQ